MAVLTSATPSSGRSCGGERWQGVLEAAQDGQPAPQQKM
jgi:hypothetical protein